MNYTEHAKVLTQALPYIQSLSGKIVVIKYGGNAMTSEELRKNVATDIVLLQCVGIKPVIVHGGGPDISDFLSKIGQESKFINGLRYTDKETMEIVQMVLGGKVNKNIVSLIESVGGKALGLCGLDGAFIKAKKLESSYDLGFVGEITSIDTKIIETALSSGYIPVPLLLSWHVVYRCRLFEKNGYPGRCADLSASKDNRNPINPCNTSTFYQLLAKSKPSNSRLVYGLLQSFLQYLPSIWDQIPIRLVLSNERSR